MAPCVALFTAQTLGTGSGEIYILFSAPMDVD